MKFSLPKTRMTVRHFTALAAAVAIGCAFALTAVHAGEGTAPKKKKGPDKSTYVKAGADAKLKGIGRKHTPSPVIFPDQVLPLRFTHRVHLDEDITCTDCHDGSTMSGPGVGKSVRSKDNNLPVESTCFDCHDTTDEDADPPADCSTCHPGYKPLLPDEFDPDNTHKLKDRPKVSIAFPAPNLKMNHKRHLELGIECKVCHGTLEDVDYASRENALPKMGTCVGKCHSGVEREFVEKGKKVKLRPPKECKTCHITKGDGRLQTKFPSGELKPQGHVFGDAHDENWLKNHKLVAGQNDEHCNNCHKPSFCVDCHNGVRKPLKIHPNNWVLAHPIAARKNNPDCQSCHKTQTFCVDCHNTTKVGGDLAKNPLRESGRLSFHPAGWAATPRGANHHAFQAKRNIRACTSCHTEATCLKCHKSTGTVGQGTNPHPLNFKTSGDCKRLFRMNPRVCAKCHEAGSAAFSCQ